MTFHYLSAWLLSRSQVRGGFSFLHAIMKSNRRFFLSGLSVVLLHERPFPRVHVIRTNPSGQIVLSITGDPWNVRRAGLGEGGSCLLPSAELTSRSCKLPTRGREYRPHKIIQWFPSFQQRFINCLRVMWVPLTSLFFA